MSEKKPRKKHAGLHDKFRSLRRVAGKIRDLGEEVAYREATIREYVIAKLEKRDQEIEGLKAQVATLRSQVRDLKKQLRSKKRKH